MEYQEQKQSEQKVENHTKGEGFGPLLNFLFFKCQQNREKNLLGTPPSHNSASHYHSLRSCVIHYHFLLTNLSNATSFCIFLFQFWHVSGQTN